jgi:tetraacyldisaccharide 4'-kinase
MRAALERFLLARWYGRPGLLLLLFPLELLFRGVVALRRWRRARGAPPVPLLVVGNITVGGTGKTPVVLALANALALRGLRVGLVARGHGGTGPFPLDVTADTPAAACGDEPRLLAQRTGLPLVVAPDRNAALARLLARARPEVVLADDGLQHLALPRTAELVVIDGVRGLGNGHCLPVGPLREPARRLRRVDYVVVNGAGRIERQLRGAGLPVSLLAVRPRALRAVADPARTLAVDDFRARYGTRLRAAAGIGNPQRFFDTLAALGFDVQSRAFPDHHAWQAVDLAGDMALPLVMTEKDAVKCRAFAGPDDWYLEVDGVLEAALVDDIVARLGLAQREGA